MERIIKRARTMILNYKGNTCENGFSENDNEKTYFAFFKTISIDFTNWMCSSIRVKHFCEATKEAIANNMGPLDVTAVQNISNLTDIEINQWNCTANTKTRVKGFRDYTRIFLADTDALAQIRREMLCPITLGYPIKPILSPCCDRVFDKTALYLHLRNIYNYKQTRIGKRKRRKRK